MNQQRVASYPRQQADSFCSRVLSALATCIESDTVSKVKKVITDLIIKVMEEAKEDASHNCRGDTELSTSVKLMEEANRQDTSSLSSLSMPTLIGPLRSELRRFLLVTIIVVENLFCSFLCMFRAGSC